MLIYPILPFWVFFSLSRPIPQAPSRSCGVYMSILCLYFWMSFWPQQKVWQLFAHFSHRHWYRRHRRPNRRVCGDTPQRIFSFNIPFCQRQWKIEIMSRTHLPLPRLSGNNFLSFGRRESEWESDAGRTPLTSTTTTNHIVKMNNVDGGLVCAAQNYVRQRYSVTMCHPAVCRCSNPISWLLCWSHNSALNEYWMLLNTHSLVYYCSLLLLLFGRWNAVCGCRTTTTTLSQTSFFWVRGKLSSFGSSFFSRCFVLFIRNREHWLTTDACIWQCVVAHNSVSEQYCTLLSNAISRTWFDPHADHFIVMCVRFFSPGAHKIFDIHCE